MTAHEPASTPPQRYVPGRAGWKLALCLCGVALFCIGGVLLAAPLRLLIAGDRAQAVASRVVRTKPSMPDTVVGADELAHLASSSPTDGTVFFDEFEFRTGDGRNVAVRENVGGRLKPLYPLNDTEGLPTTKLVIYDPRRPTTAIFPGEISTWLVPVGLTLAGLACALISATLYRWANRPIELPDMSPWGSERSL